MQLFVLKSRFNCFCRRLSFVAIFSDGEILRLKKSAFLQETIVMNNTRTAQDTVQKLFARRAQLTNFNAIAVTRKHSSRFNYTFLAKFEGCIQCCGFHKSTILLNFIGDNNLNFRRTKTQSLTSILASTAKALSKIMYL